MFYSHSLLSRKGPLGTIWVAAFCFKKLRKEQINDTDISSSVDKILPEIQISYRILAQLLLGIVKIFSKKVDFLYHDCNEALAYVRSFAPGQRTISKGATKRSYYIVKQVATVKYAPQTKEVSSPEPIEAMRAPSDHVHVTFTLPKRFELDSFDLEISDERDAAEAHQLSAPKDVWEDEHRHVYFQDKESYLRETMGHAEFNSACFTPVDDVFPTEMMDIELDTSEPCNFNISAEKGEKLQGELRNLDEHGRDEDIGSKEKSNKTPLSGLEKEINEEREPLRPIVLNRRISWDNEKTDSFPAENLIAVTPAEAVDQSHLQNDSGLVSPKFTVTTPAKKEHVRRLRKRKTLFDETIVLSNQTLRQAIHDASSVVCKRRKAPHTSLDTWKMERITSLNFVDPLMLDMPKELQALFYHKPPEYSAEETTGHHVNTENVQNGPSNEKVTDNDGTFQDGCVGTSAETYMEEFSRANKLDELEPSKSSPTGQTFDSAFELMDRDLGFDGADDGAFQGSRWSTRTRVVARYLHEGFLNLSRRKQNNLLSLARILDGKTRKTCARFFYETLILKGHGFIDVKQDSPYADIFISPTPQLEAGTLG
ncbi:sister chromatid cohesion 1 protein 3-like isoform X2 [Ananas comosus]|uniref:Sister chromatid cohesion 1 protein 3-like isoform X2 n=1 Tax=Ananas comosus TaxID=4615 RepID=A0A6P5H394_ANACO|nr:sister chromatid cohesion 1 protein 3-like isoform X2 [Ananas comosus]